MEIHTARVKNGRLVMDEPTDLPEGEVVELCRVNPDDDMDPAEREALDAAIERSWAQHESGNSRPIGDVLAELRRRR